MRQDWIEFEENDGAKTTLRPEYIMAIHDIPHKKQDGFQTIISYDFGGGNETKLAICEPYEQVKQKIMDAEKVDLSDVVVEHFNRVEYMYLLKLLNNHLAELEKAKDIEAINPNSLINQLRYKLNKILKEEG